MSYTKTNLPGTGPIKKSVTHPMDAFDLGTSSVKENVPLGLHPYIGHPSIT